MGGFLFCIYHNVRSNTVKIINTAIMENNMKRTFFLLTRARIMPVAAIYAPIIHQISCKNIPINAIIKPPAKSINPNIDRLLFSIGALLVCDFTSALSFPVTIYSTLVFNTLANAIKLYASGAQASVSHFETACLDTPILSAISSWENRCAFLSEIILLPIVIILPRLY